jgi:A/G-specific adenine glycosylase
MNTEKFAARVVSWQKRFGRHDLPWQQTRDPYRVWLSEIMLQQTQVATVIDYYLRFLQRFPNLGSLAQASQDDVLALWAGLGYYSRARNLHRCAQVVQRDHHGQFPKQRVELEQLPGIGRSTAAAIASFCFDQAEPILDGNVKRVFTRHFGVKGVITQNQTINELWSLVETQMPSKEVVGYTQGLMDLGATLCTLRKPKCETCPVSASCVAFREGRQAELPARAKKKETPTRYKVFLVATHENSIWLEKQPEPGIWGGLYCFPSLFLEEPLAKACEGDIERLPSSVSNWVASKALAMGSTLDKAPGLNFGGGFKHAFTHYKLDADVLVLELNAEQAAKSNHNDFYTGEAVKSLGLPQPISRWLSHFQAQNSPVRKFGVGAKTAQQD